MLGDVLLLGAVLAAEAHIQFFIYQLLRGLKYLHSAGAGCLPASPHLPHMCFVDHCTPGLRCRTCMP
jgi:hypothetical protein